MDRLTQALRQIDLLDECVDATLATLSAIHGANLFDSLPADPDQASLHNDGMHLLSMLEQHIRSLRAQADQLGAARTEGR